MKRGVGRFVNALYRQLKKEQEKIENQHLTDLESLDSIEEEESEL